MTSRRLLKKKINVIVNNIIEEAYSVQILNPGKTDKETNKIIDEAVEMFDELLNRVHSAKEVGDSKELKKHYDAIDSDLEKTSLQLMGKLDKVG